MQHSKPLVSVCFITYNHEKYVRQALESVFNQECDFDFEVVIGNDCSTDNTTQIVHEFLRKYPQKIRLNVLKENVGMTANWISTISECKGKYIALLEGDDFWTDNKKIQKQADFLMHHPEFSFVAHDVNVIKEADVWVEDSLLHFAIDGVFAIEDCLKLKVFLQTSSIFFNRSMLPAFPNWADKRVKSIDYLVYLMLASQTPLYYMAQKMSTYRLHNAGVSHLFWRTKKNTIQFDIMFILKNFNKFTDNRFKEMIEDKIETLYLELITGNSPASYVYKKALMGLLFLRPLKHMDLFKGYLINNCVPPKFYTLYQKLFKK